MQDRYFVTESIRGMKTRRAYIVGIILIFCLLIVACNRETPSVGPKFSGRLLLLAGNTPAGANLIELTPAPGAATFNVSTMTTGVFDATPSPDRTRLLYAIKDEILL